MLPALHPYKESPLLSWIKQLIGRPVRDYEERFAQALKRSKSWGLAPSGFRRTDERFVSEQSIQIFQQVAAAHLSHFHAEDVSQ